MFFSPYRWQLCWTPWDVSPGECFSMVIQIPLMGMQITATKFWTYYIIMLTLEICGRSLLSALLKWVVVFLWQFIPDKTCLCSATEASLPNAFVLFTLSYVSSHLWKTAVFRTGLTFGMAQCKVDLNLTVSLWMYMRLLSVTTYLRELFLCPLLN